METSQTHHHHHQHRSHKRDTSSIYKHKNLQAIEFKKKLTHWFYISLWVIAIIMFVIVVYIYI